MSRKRIILLTAALAVVAMLPLPAEAIVVTFDDLTGVVTNNPIPNGYAGFNWTNFYPLNAVNYHINPSGYLAGMVSPERVAFNGLGEPAAMVTQAQGVFHFTGTYLTAAWHTGLNIEILGQRGGDTAYSRTVTVDCLSPTWFQFDWDVDTLRFRSYGGTDYPPYSGGGEHFAMDNFTFVPEPATLSLLALGALAVIRRKRN